MRTIVSVPPGSIRVSPHSSGSRATIAATIALAVGLAGCGSSTPSGTTADPATLAPGSAALYASAHVNPQGSLRKDALADAQTLAHSREPFGPLLQALAGSSPLGHVNYAKEVKPWLGPSGGVFATSPAAIASAAQALQQSLGGGLSFEALLKAGAASLMSASGSGSALVLDTSDPAKARAFIARLSHRQGAHQVDYRGTSLDVDPNGHAEAIVSKFAVFGNEAGVKATIDTHLGGPSLKAAAPYATLISKGPSGVLASIYLDPGAAGQGAAGQGTAGSRAAGQGTAGSRAARSGAAGPPASQMGAILQALPGEPKQARISIVPSHSSVTVDADLLSSPQSESKAAASANAAAQLVGELPSGSWLALGSGEGGTRAGSDLALLSGLVSLESKSLLSSFGGPALQRLLSSLASHPQTLQRLFAGWAGPGAAFAAGSGLLNIEAGLAIESNSNQAARAAVARLGALLSAAGASVTSTSIPGAEAALSVHVPGLPVTLDVGSGGHRFVIGLGPASVQGAISPSSTLSSSSSYAAASSTLAGTKLSALVEFPMALALLEGIGLNESPAFAPAIATLRPLRTLAGGVQPLGGGVIRLHVVLGLNG